MAVARHTLTYVHDIGEDIPPAARGDLERVARAYWRESVQDSACVPIGEPAAILEDGAEYGQPGCYWWRVEGRVRPAGPPR